MKRGRFQNKTGLVTGAAGGIGSTVARAFVEEGASVVMVDVNDEVGTNLSKSLVDEGLSVEYRHGDVADEQGMRNLFRGIASDHPRLDFAANLVSVISQHDTLGGNLHEASETGWDETVRLTLRTTFLSMKHEIAAMFTTGGGSIVNVASTAGLHIELLPTAAYSAAKAAVIHLTKYAAAAYGDRWIRVNAIAPGITRTPQVVQVLGDEGIQYLVDFQSLPRAATPRDQANAILWLSSDDAAMVTGHILPVAGGWDSRGGPSLPGGVRTAHTR